MKSDCAGFARKMEINPERVESNWCGRRRKRRRRSIFVVMRLLESQAPSGATSARGGRNMPLLTELENVLDAILQRFRP
jgi:hypothetical protein